MANARNHPENTPDGQQAKASAAKDDSKVADQVQDAIDVETEQGFRGIEVDKTPNEAYTLAGQNAGMPTPETDEDTAKAALEGRKEAQSKATGVAER
jgi:hypothetical protein